MTIEKPRVIALRGNVITPQKPPSIENYEFLFVYSNTKNVSPQKIPKPKSGILNSLFRLFARK